MAHPLRNGAPGEPALYCRFRGRARSPIAPSLVFAAIWTVVFAGLAANAEVKLANIFGSGGILQHGKPAPVWGLANPGEAVKVALQGINGCALSREAETVADHDGKWIVTFDPLTAGDAFHLVAKGRDSTAAAYNMLAGDVWFYAGKYRFRYLRLIPEITEKGWKEANADLFPLLRLYATAGVRDDAGGCAMPQRAEDGRWVGPEAYSIFGFSPGILCHFAIEQVRQKKIPVGIVYAASIYDHGIDEYLPAEAFVQDPVLGQTEEAKKLAWFVGGTEACKALNNARIAYMETYLADSIKRNEAGDDVPPPDFPEAPDWARTKTSAAYNSAIYPTLPFAVRGVVVNDPGGAQPMDARTHGAKLERLVDALRKGFGDPALPVFLIQEHAHGQQNTILATTRFAVQQMLAQKDRHAFRVVYQDVEIHPDTPGLFLKTIPAIGRRLHALVERHVDGNPSPSNEMPELVGFREGPQSLVLTFSMPLKTADGLEPAGFAIKDKGQSVFRPASAVISSNEIALSAPGVTAPEHANYGFVNAAMRNKPNVVGVNGMPVAAFSTEWLGEGERD